MALKKQKHLVVCHHIHRPSPQWGNQHLIAQGLGIVWKYKWSFLKMANYTTTPTYLAGVSCGRHDLRWQIWPNRSSSDGPRLSCPVLWMAIIRRRTELGWGMRCHVYAVGSHWLDWQTSPSQCKPSEPGQRLAVDCPSLQWMMHQIQGTWPSLLHSACIITI